MEKGYLTVTEPGTDEITEKKSRFIGYVCHADTEEEAESFVAAIRRKHYDARHNCYAYCVDGQRKTVRFSDDGEPGGTAGKPILEVITGQGLCDVCVVVTRYFGGTLLGTGGLVRAYTQAAKACIAAAGVVRMRKVIPVVLTMDYTALGKVQYLLKNEGISVGECVYDARVKLHVRIPAEDADRVLAAITELTAAGIEIERLDAVFASC